MPPLFSCFPVCLTFIALGILGLLIFVTGMVGAGPGATADTADAASPARDDQLTGPPAWWVVLFIFAAVAVAFFFLNWVGADW